jgi:hypothetical protein
VSLFNEGALRRIFSAVVTLAAGVIPSRTEGQDVAHAATVNLVPYPSDEEVPVRTRTASRKPPAAVVTIGNVIIVGVAGISRKPALPSPEP